MPNAKDLMRIPIAQMLGRWPLFGAIIASWEIVTGSVDTVGIGMGRSGLCLYVNTGFVLSLTIEQTIAVLHHEIRHVVYGHIYQMPSEFADPAALTIAQEVTVNENLPGPLPGNPVILADFPQLPVDEDTLTRYRRLEVPPKPEDPASEPQHSQLPGMSDQIRPGDKKGQTSPSSRASETPNNGAASDDEFAQDGSSATHPKTLDSHEHWGEIVGQPTLIRQQVEAIARRVQAAASAGHVTLQPAESEMVASILGRGSMSGGQLTRLGRGRAEVDWRQRLRRWAGQYMKPTPTYQHPSRRFPHLLGVVPGRRRLPKRPRILVAIDTSASISQTQLSNFSAEIARIASGREIWVAEVDAEIKSIYRYKGPITAVTGRSGTSFLPIFEPPITLRVKPDLVIYLTDGEGPAPEHAPRFPVLWVLTPDGRKPALWGHAIWLDGSN